MKKGILSVIALGIVYFFGAATVQYSLFPYEYVVKLRNSLKKDMDNTKRSPYYLNKVSQFELFSNNSYSTVMIGDSITDGGEWHELLNLSTIQNRGIGGDTTDGVLERLNSINSNVKNAFIMIGINDFSQYKSVDDVFSNYLKIIDELENKKIKVYIQSTLYVGKILNTKRNYNENVFKLNTKLKDYSEKNNLVFIDLNKVLAPNGYLKDDYSFDELHLNGNGYMVWAKILEKYIKNL